MNSQPEIDAWAAAWGIGGASNALDSLFKEQSDATRDPAALELGAAMVKFLATYDGRALTDTALVSKLYRDTP